MKKLVFLIQFAMNMSWGLMIMGYVAYKLGFVKSSWEDGVKWIFTGTFKGLLKIVRWMKEEASGESLNDMIIDTALMLNKQEILELVRTLEKQPYDTPTIESFTQNANGIMWTDVSPVGLSSEYKDIDNEMIKEITERKIQNFFMTTRERQVPLYIKVASPTRLYFAIPLSQAGQEFLEKQEQNKEKVAIPKNVPDVLEEEIDIFEDTENQQIDIFEDVESKDKSKKKKSNDTGI